MCHIIGIKTIYKNLKKLPITTAIPVVFILAAAVFNLLVLAQRDSSAEAFGGSPYLASLEESFNSEADSILADNVFVGEFELSNDQDSTAGFVVVEKDSVLNSSIHLSTILPTRDGLLVYKIQEGDTLSRIAVNFDISLNTIFWANKNVGSNIRPGQEIIILPVSGVLHQVEEGDTLESVAAIYSVSTDKILQYNKRLGGGLRVGSEIVIPDAKPKQSSGPSFVSNLPSYPGYYIIPTTGWNWGKLHYNNAIDVANACGTPIFAAAEGLITRERSYGWNEGYGHLIEIEHPNGTVTRYAHTNKNIASLGDYVLQGDLIGYIGNTGKTHGPTGCHLHFEIKGAKNPFAK